MNHTKEPWVAEKTLQGRDSSISNSRGKTIAIAYQNNNIDGDDLANAKRIALCVNACEGITNEALEAGVVDGCIEIVKNQTPEPEDGIRRWMNIPVYEEDV